MNKSHHGSGVRRSFFILPTYPGVLSLFWFVARAIALDSTVVATAAAQHRQSNPSEIVPRLSDQVDQVGLGFFRVLSPGAKMAAMDVEVTCLAVMCTISRSERATRWRGRAADCSFAAQSSWIC